MIDQVTISHYRILSKLGGGGMGVVYKAGRTFALHRFVALKFLPDECRQGSPLPAVFNGKQKAASALNSSQRVCTIYEIGQARRPGFHRHGVPGGG